MSGKRTANGRWSSLAASKSSRRYHNRQLGREQPLEYIPLNKAIRKAKL